jgi:hypothetical protein
MSLEAKAMAEEECMQEAVGVAKEKAQVPVHPRKKEVAEEVGILSVPRISFPRNVLSCALGGRGGHGGAGRKLEGFNEKDFLIKNQWKSFQVKQNLAHFLSNRSWDIFDV